MLDETLSTRMQKLQITSMKEGICLAIDCVHSEPIDHAIALMKRQVESYEDLEMALEQKIKKEESAHGLPPSLL